MHAWAAEKLVGGAGARASVASIESVWTPPGATRSVWPKCHTRATSAYPVIFYRGASPASYGGGSSTGRFVFAAERGSTADDAASHSEGDEDDDEDDDDDLSPTEHARQEAILALAVAVRAFSGDLDAIAQHFYAPLNIDLTSEELDDVFANFHQLVTLALEFNEAVIYRQARDCMLHLLCVANAGGAGQVRRLRAPGRRCPLRGSRQDDCPLHRVLCQPVSGHCAFHSCL